MVGITYKNKSRTRKSPHFTSFMLEVTSPIHSSARCSKHSQYRAEVGTQLINFMIQQFLSLFISFFLHLEAFVASIQSALAVKAELDGREALAVREKEEFSAALEAASSTMKDELLKAHSEVENLKAEEKFQLLKEKDEMLQALEAKEEELKRATAELETRTNSLTLKLVNMTDTRRGFYHTAFSVDSMLYILGRSRKFEKIWDVLVDVKLKDRSLITPWTVMVVLGRIAKVCSVRQTVESFRKFKKFVPEFDVACFNALLRTLCQEKSMTDARNVYHGMKSKFRPNLQTFNILLSGWKSSEEAEGFFDEMREMGVKPDVVSYNCLVDVYCKNREMDKAYKVVERMRDEDIHADVITYTSIIGGLGLIVQPDKARNILKEMKEYGCYPDVAAYNAGIRNFCIAKRLREAFDLMDEMVNKGLSPNATTYNLFFRIFLWSNDLQSWEIGIFDPF
ncbi:putative pentatricopeptide repeat-containing protein At1g02420 [Momordica charantia]|uniref:Pentatricopeptide repeat-containing protein At1g02420 n=1 Tax=Momordica charantia TaxID=3673 RepID=A0A6J1DVA7_MOMCH|nr:putative pentatricopeptide repeat-containing protein At1g02420 [Momordica charantia]